MKIIGKVKAFGFEFWVLNFSLILVRFPIPFEFLVQLIIQIFCGLLLLFIAIRLFFRWYSAKKPLREKNKFLLILFCIYFIFINFAYLRVSQNEKIFPDLLLWSWLNWALLALIALLIFINDENSEHLRQSIYYSLILFISINIILHILGFVNPYEYFYKDFPAIMLKTFGIYTNRIVFPMAIGINNFGILGGACLVVSFFLLRKGPSSTNRLIGLIGIISGLYVILYTDSRASLFLALFTILVSFISFRLVHPLFRWIAALTPIFPVALMSFVGIFPQTISAYLSRSVNSRGIYTVLSGREEIWNSVINFFKVYESRHLFGFGFRGQFLSGVSINYSKLFIAWSNPEIVTAHNFPLQSTLEIGYIGLFILIVGITLLLNNLGINYFATSDHSYIILFYLIIFLLLAGTTESVFTLEFPLTLSLLMFIWAMVGSRKISLNENAQINSKGDQPNFGEK